MQVSFFVSVGDLLLSFNYGAPAPRGVRMEKNTLWFLEDCSHWWMCDFCIAASDKIFLVLVCLVNKWCKIISSYMWSIKKKKCYFSWAWNSQAGCCFSFKHQLLLLVPVMERVSLCTAGYLSGSSLLALVYEIIRLAVDASNSFGHSAEMPGESLFARHYFTAFITSLGNTPPSEKGKKAVLSFAYACMSVCYSFVKMKHSLVNSWSLIGFLLSLFQLCRHPWSYKILSTQVYLWKWEQREHLVVNVFKKHCWGWRVDITCCGKGDTAQGQLWAWGQGGLNSKSWPPASLLTAEGEP